MPRLETDMDAGREALLVTIEEMIRRRGAFDLSVTDLAAEAGMSPSNVYRFFENKDTLFEAIAERWFADKIAIMEEVTASNLPVREKMYHHFARRFRLMLDRFNEEPDLFKSYCELGQQHFEVVRGYVDLGDHYLSLIVAEAMDQGYFADLTIDRTVSLINQMVAPYCNPDNIVMMAPKLSEEKLAQIVDAIFVGLGKSVGNAALSTDKPVMTVVS